MVESRPDWARVLETAERAGLAPLVYSRLHEATTATATATATSELIPCEVMRRLRQQFQQSIVLSVVLRRQLREALLRLADAHLPVVVAGEVLLATRVYPSPTLRSLQHIDLLVHADDVDRVKLLLHDVPSVAFRLHAELFELAGVVDDFFSRALTVDVEGVPSLVCMPEDLLLHVAVDFGRRLGDADDVATHLAALCDIAAIYRAYRTAFDWRRIVEQAHAYLTGTLASAALRVVLQHLDLDIPAVALQTLTPTPPLLESRREPGQVAVTYDNSSTDGVGSQLQRIYALFALSRALDVRYLHTPLGRVGYQGLMPLLSGQIEPDFATRYNAVFSIPSDDFDVRRAQHIRIHTLTRRVVERYRQHAGQTGQSVLLSTCIPFPYTDREPASYAAVHSVSPYRHHRPEGPIRVCVHLRRGDNSVSGRSDHAERLLPNSFYLRVCQTLVEALQAYGARFVIRMHTEIPPRAHTLYPGDPGLYFRLDQPGTIDPATYALDDFAGLPNLEIVANVDAANVLEDFATADVLVLSRSSLGYVAGLLNPHGLVVWAPWWHAPLPTWLAADAQGNLDAAQVRTRIATLVARRSGPPTPRC